MFEQKTVWEAEKLLSARADGLTQKEVRERLGAYGPNELEEKRKKTTAERFLSQLADPLIYVLFAAGAVSILLGELGDAVIIGVVVLLNAAVGVIQEGKAQKALDALKKMTRLKAVVRREGRMEEIDAAGLVPGDVVILEAGRQVPADLRLIRSENLRIEESALTGESVPAKKDASFLADRGLPAGDCQNLAYMSTNVTAGRGEGFVTATGMNTEIGKIARLIRETPEEATPLQKRLGDLGGLLSVLAIALCAALFLVAVWQHRPVGEMLITAISLAVAAVPEGLPAVVTIVLALSVSRMVKVHTIVRRLPSVETLGAVSVVCSDKTGTLTKNQMTVEVWETGGEIIKGQSLPAQQTELTKAFVLCSDAVLTGGGRRLYSDAALNGEGRKKLYGDAARTGGGRRRLYSDVPSSAGERNNLRNDTLPSGAEAQREVGFLGDPTETALLSYAAEQFSKVGKNGRNEVEALRKEWPRIGERPFESSRKRMTTVHKHGTETVSYTKGAPDVILSRCDFWLSGEETVPLSGFQKEKILRRVAELSRQAYRVLGAAETPGDGRAEQGMVFLGLAAMMDPPRPEAAEAVELFSRANVRTVMITGDHKETAFAIAKKLQIANDMSQCMTGEELDRIEEKELEKRLPSLRVFARVSPDHKVKLVRAYKQTGNIVAMTGDGVNDAPSLRAADVGIAMGKSGTDVAKQAADMILTDDHFATIEKAIEEGRGVYENIRKSVIFLLSSNFGEIMTMFLAILFSFPSPLKASHILWINLITDSLPALALGVDENDGRELMSRPPRKPGESLFSRGGLPCMLFYGALITIISLTAFLKLPVETLSAMGKEITLENLRLVLGNPGILTASQTYSFTVLGLSQLFHAVGMRDVEKSVFRMNHWRNKLMLAAFGIGFLLQLSVTEIPFLVSVFQTVRLSAGEWGELLILAAAPMAAHELLILLSRAAERRGAPSSR